MMKTKVQQTTPPVVSIIAYRPEHQPWFEKFNRDWIEQYFWMEPIDFEVLQHPEEHIISKGGHILMATADKEIAATVALKFAAPGVYEFTKMAVDEKFRGQHIGKQLAEAAIEKAKSLGAHKIILYSSSKLAPALALYRKIGFKDIPVDGPYKRSDVKMELILKHSNAYLIREILLSDLTTLKELARQTFIDTFSEHNTKENMSSYLDQNFSDERFLSELNDPKSKFFFLLDGTVPAGYARLRESENPEGVEGNALEIERLYVDRAYHGRKAGQALMDYCLQYASERKFQVVWLGVWEKNLKAIKFYGKYAFQRFGDHVFMLGDDAQTDWLMKKQLA